LGYKSVDSGVRARLPLLGMRLGHSARPVAAGAPSRSITSSSAPRGARNFDLDRLVALCPPCHALTDAPYVRGRLVITALGAGRFPCEVTRGADKWAIRAEPTAVDALPVEIP